MKAGAAKIDITPPAGRLMAGYASRTQPSTGTHDPLYARALVCEAGGACVALVAVDLCEVPERVYTAVVRGVQSRTGIGQEHLQVMAVHTHGGPDFCEPDAYEEMLIERLVGVVQTAFRERREAILAVGTGTVSGIGVNRRRADGPVDSDVTVVRVDDPEGRPIATLMNYSSHPTTLGPDNLQYTADYPGVACTAVDQAIGGIAIFTTGALGDVNPGGYSAEGSMIGEVVPWRNYGSAAQYGAAVARVALAVREGLRPAQVDCVWGRDRVIAVARKPLPTTAEAAKAVELAQAALRQASASGTAGQVAAAKTAVVYAQILAAQAAAPDRDRPVAVRLSALGIGPVTHVGVPGELFTDFGLQIKREVGQGSTLVAVYCNGTLGYIPTREAMESGGYEPAASILIPEGGEMITRAAIDLALQQ